MFWFEFATKWIKIFNWNNFCSIFAYLIILIYYLFYKLFYFYFKLNIWFVIIFYNVLIYRKFKFKKFDRLIFGKMIPWCQSIFAFIQCLSVKLKMSICAILHILWFIWYRLTSLIWQIESVKWRNRLTPRYHFGENDTVYFFSIYLEFVLKHLCKQNQLFI